MTTASTTVLACSGETDDLEQQLTAIQAERDQLVAELEEVTAQLDRTTRGQAVDHPSERNDTALANQTMIADFLDNPESFGTEEEIADRLDELAAPGARMVDDVFGSVSCRTGFLETLYGGNTDARIAIYDRWLSDDGS